jgi:hypothetical protein
MMDIVERLIVYRDRPGRSREGRELLAEAVNEIDRLRKAMDEARDHLNQGIGMLKIIQSQRTSSSSTGS